MHFPGSAFFFVFLANFNSEKSKFYITNERGIHRFRGTYADGKFYGKFIHSSGAKIRLSLIHI